MVSCRHTTRLYMFQAQTTASPASGQVCRSTNSKCRLRTPEETSTLSQCFLLVSPVCICRCDAFICSCSVTSSWDSLSELKASQPACTGVACPSAKIQWFAYRQPCLHWRPDQAHSIQVGLQSMLLPLCGLWKATSWCAAACHVVHLARPRCEYTGAVQQCCHIGAELHASSLICECSSASQQTCRDPSFGRSQCSQCMTVLARYGSRISMPHQATHCTGPAAVVSCLRSACEMLPKRAAAQRQTFEEYI